MRNAARHARPDASAAPLRLQICLTGGRELLLTVEDNGVGLPSAANGGEPEPASQDGRRTQAAQGTG